MVIGDRYKHKSIGYTENQHHRAEHGPDGFKLENNHLITILGLLSMRAPSSSRAWGTEWTITTAKQY